METAQSQNVWWTTKSPTRYDKCRWRDRVPKRPGTSNLLASIPYRLSVIHSYYMLEMLAIAFDRTINVYTISLHFVFIPCYLDLRPLHSCWNNRVWVPSQMPISTVEAKVSTELPGDSIANTDRRF